MGEGGALIINNPMYNEKAEILKALALFRNNRSRTAEYLNMHPSTLWRKMKKYGI